MSSEEKEPREEPKGKEEDVVAHRYAAEGSTAEGSTAEGAARRRKKELADEAEEDEVGRRRR